MAAAASPEASAVLAVLMTDFTRVREVLFLTARFMSWRARFLADLWLANYRVLHCGSRRIVADGIAVDGHLSVAERAPPGHFRIIANAPIRQWNRWVPEGIALRGRWLRWAGRFCCAIAWSAAASAQPQPAERVQDGVVWDESGSLARQRSEIPGMNEVRAVWNAPADSLEKRATKTRRSALELGIWNLDAAARSLVASGNSEPSVAQARAAIALAPDLPMARMALARALLLQEKSPVAALRATWAALAAIPRHLEASVWFAGIGSYVLALALICGGLLCLAVSASAVARHAAHDLGDAVSGGMPAFASVALLAAIVMLPMALGQGLVGAGLGLLGLAALYGSMRQFWVLMLASAAVVLGLYPVAQFSGAALTAYSQDSVVEASYSATEGFATPVDRLRLEQGADSDPLAALALAVTERRSGNLEAADVHYQGILDNDSRNQAVLNNAANVRLNLGDVDLALDLYQLAAKVGDSPRVLFNLSQAYGASFAVDDLVRTLASAQRLDGDVVAELTRLQGSDQKGFTIDLPVDRRMLWERAYHGSAASDLAAEFRSGFAPGLLGSRWWIALAAFVGVAIVASIAATRLRASHLCRRCGRRLCPRCDPEFAGGETCEGCTRLFHQPETTDRSLRLARINMLRHRDARLSLAVLLVSIFVPGSAGLFVQRHGWSLIGSFSAALAIAAIVFRNGVAVDPMVAGSAAPVVFGGIAALCLATYAVSVWASLASGRRS